MNLPPVPSDPPLEECLQRGLSRVLAGSRAAGVLAYRSGFGTEEERLAGTAWLRPTLGEVEPGRVLVSPGAQPALLAILRILAEPGDAVLADNLTYPGIKSAAAQLGVRLVGIAADSEGPVPEVMDQACREMRPKLLYCVPTMHNPTTVTMPLARRRAIADAARRHGMWVLEDDAYGLLPSAPLPAIAALAPDICYHVATVSKVLSPALRVAYLVAPDASRAARVAAALRANVLMASPILTGLLAAWIHDGTATAVVAAIRKETVARQKIAQEILPSGQVDAHPEGLHLWLRLSAHWDRRDFVAHLQRQDGLAVVPSDAFLLSGAGPAPDAVRLALGAAGSREALREALRSVAAALREEIPAPFSQVV
jgi:DNA-binding transcriptional MocR family regulator